MKLTKTASGKILLTCQKWLGIGIKAGWINREAYSDYRGVQSGTGMITVQLYRSSDGIISVLDEGIPFQADIYFSYSPEEAPKYEGSQMSYTGASERIDIIDIKDNVTEESIYGALVNHESIEETFRDRMLAEYKRKSEYAYESTMENRGEEMRLKDF